MCALRRKLGLDRGRVSAIRTTNHGYVLDPAAAKTDLHEFRVLLQAAEGADPRAALDCLEAAVGLVTGELLAGEPYARWANQERSVLQNELVGRATLAARHAVSLGEPAVAVDGAHGGGRRRARGGGLAVADARAVGLRPALGALRAYPSSATPSARSSAPTRPSRPRRCTSRSCATSRSSPTARGRTVVTRS